MDEKEVILALERIHPEKGDIIVARCKKASYTGADVAKIFQSLSEKVDEVCPYLRGKIIWVVLYEDDIGLQKLDENELRRLGYVKVDSLRHHIIKSIEGDKDGNEG